MPALREERASSGNVSEWREVQARLASSQQIAAEPAVSAQVRFYLSSIERLRSSRVAEAKSDAFRASDLSVPH